jgi:hypothetical protein
MQVPGRVSRNAMTIWQLLAISSRKQHRHVRQHLAHQHPAQLRYLENRRSTRRALTSTINFISRVNQEVYDV